MKGTASPEFLVCIRENYFYRFVVGLSAEERNEPTAWNVVVLKRLSSVSLVLSPPCSPFGFVSASSDCGIYIADLIPDAGGALPIRALSLKIDGAVVFNGWGPTLGAHQVIQGWPDASAITPDALMAPPSTTAKAFRFGECLREADTAHAENIVKLDHPILKRFGKMEFSVYNVIKLEVPTIAHHQPP